MAGGGFGHGPFGHGPFGESNWAQRAMYDKLPADTKAADVDNGGYLQLFFEVFYPALDELRRTMRDVLDLKDPLLVRGGDEGQVLLKLGAISRSYTSADARGVDGSVPYRSAFQATSARFQAEDRGKTLTIRRADTESNNRDFDIVSIVDRNTVLTYPPIEVDTNAALRWEMKTPKALSENQIMIEVLLGDVRTIRSGWALKDGRGSFLVEGRNQFLRRPSRAEALVEFLESNGVVAAPDLLTTPTYRYTTWDVHKPVFLKGFEDTTLDGLYRIGRVLSATSVQLTDLDGAAIILSAEEDLVWALLPLPEIILEGTFEPEGVASWSGVALIVEAGGTEVSSSEAAFVSSDAGKFIEIMGSALGNDGVYEVDVVLTANKVSLVGVTLTVESGLRWVMRSVTRVGDKSQVKVLAPRYLPRLARDFGFEIDENDALLRQRSWVVNLNQWLDAKGHGDNYEALGRIGGFEIEAFRLFRIRRNVTFLSLSGDVIEVGDEGETRSGFDGTLSQTGGFAYLTTPAAPFEPRDVNAFIRISGADTTSNNARYTILEVVSASVVKFHSSESVTLPEANNGVLQWNVLELFTDKEPRYAQFDHINIDLLVAIVDAESAFLGESKEFAPDRPCWHEDWSSDVVIDVITVTSLTASSYRLTIIDATAFGAARTPEVILKAGNWHLVDSAGGDFIIETIPVEGSPGEYDVDVLTLEPPVTGVGYLYYDCSILPTCEFCPSSTVLLDIELADLASATGLEIERATERLMDRLLETTPINVRLVPRFTGTTRITITFGVIIGPNVGEGAPIHVQLGTQFDITPMDEEPLDTATLVVRIVE